VIDRKLNANASGVLSVTLAGGARTELSGSGPTVFGLRAIAREPLDGKLLVVGDLAGGPGINNVPQKPGLLRMDPTSGARTVVSGGGMGLGPSFLIPTDVVAFGGRVYLVSDEWGNAIFAVDGVSGDRVILTH
jgi:hypothetical protein